MSTVLAVKSQERSSTKSQPFITLCKMPRHTSPHSTYSDVLNNLLHSSLLTSNTWQWHQDSQEPFSPSERLSQESKSFLLGISSLSPPLDLLPFGLLHLSLGDSSLQREVLGPRNQSSLTRSWNQSLSNLMMYVPLQKSPLLGLLSRRERRRRVEGIAQRLGIRVKEGYQERRERYRDRARANN